MNKLVLATVIAFVVPISTANGACYTVTDKANATVYQSSIPPFDLSKSISEGVEKLFPGGHLVMSIYDCNSGSGFTDEDADSYEILSENYSKNASPRRRSSRGSQPRSGQYIGNGSYGDVRAAGTDVTVRSYQRNGQTVQGHTRAAPVRAR